MFIRKNVRLIGEGLDKTCITGDSTEYVVKVKTKEFTAQGIHFKHEGKNYADVMVIQGGSVTINACKFSGGNAHHINTPRVIGGDGLWLDQGAKGTIRDCCFESNALNGLDTHQRVSINIENCTAVKNRNGLCFVRDSRIRAKDCTCMDNTEYGIYVGENAQASVENCICNTQRSYSGIVFYNQASGTAQKNVCAKNNLHGIQVSSVNEVKLQENTCKNNSRDGIAAFRAAVVTITGCTCSDNQGSGISIQQEASAKIQNNTFDGNKAYGIEFLDLGRGYVDANTCHANQKGGVFVQRNANPTLEHNTFRSNIGANVVDERSLL